MVDDGLAEPILLGRRSVIAAQVREMGLRLDLDNSVRVLDPAEDAAVFGPLAERYRLMVGRRGTPPDRAERYVQTRPSVAASMLVQGGQADAALCGARGDWWLHLKYVMPIIPRRQEVSRIYAMSCLLLQSGAVFFCDTHVNVEPSAEQIAEMTLLAADAVHGFGV